MAVTVTLVLKAFSIFDYFRGFPEVALTRSKNMSILWLLNYAAKMVSKKAVLIYNVISNRSEDLFHCFFLSTYGQNHLESIPKCTCNVSSITI